MWRNTYSQINTFIHTAVHIHFKLLQFFLNWNKQICKLVCLMKSSFQTHFQNSKVFNHFQKTEQTVFQMFLFFFPSFIVTSIEAYLPTYLSQWISSFFHCRFWMFPMCAVKKKLFFSHKTNFFLCFFFYIFSPPGFSVSCLILCKSFDDTFWD